MRGSKTVKQMQQSAGMRWKYCKKYNNYHELSWPQPMGAKHNNQLDTHSNTIINEFGWRGEEESSNNNTTINRSRDNDNVVFCCAARVYYLET